MMRKKRLIVVGLVASVLVLITLLGAWADTESDLRNKAIAIFNFDGDFLDSQGSNDLTNTGTVNISTDFAKFGTQGLNFTGGYLSDGNAAADSPFNYGIGNFCYSLWVKRGTTANYEVLIGKATTWGTNGFYAVIDGDAQAGKLVTSKGAAGSYYDLSSIEADNGGWYHIVVQQNSTGKASMHFNKTYVSTQDRAWNAVNVNQSVALHIGARSTDQSNLYAGFMDELYVFNGSCSQTEINWLYSNQLTAAAPPAPSQKTLNVSGTNPVAKTVLNSLSVNVNGTINASYVTNCSLYINYSYNQSYNYSLGISVPINYNVSFNAGDERNQTYYVSCYDGYNVSNSTLSNFLVDTVSPVVVSNIQLNNTVHTQSMNLSVNVTDTYLTNFSMVDTCKNSFTNVSALSPYYFLRTLNITNCSIGAQHTNITACDGINCVSRQYNWTSRAMLEIMAFSVIDGTQITSFDIYLNGNLNGSTTTGVFDAINLDLSTYEVQIRPSGYEWKSVNVSVLHNTTYYNFSLFTRNSFNITFIDEETHLLLVNVTTVEFIGSYESHNVSLVNGSLYIDLLTPDEYRIRYWTAGYTERFYYVELVNNSYNRLQLYMIKNTSATEVTLNVYDEISSEVEGAYVHVQRYNVTSNTFKTVEICRTNFEGVCKIDVVLSSEFYKFQIEKPLGTLRDITSSTQLYETNINLQINLGGVMGDQFFKENNVNTVLGFNNLTSTFVLSYSDSQNKLSEMCLKVYSVGRMVDNLLSESCLSTQSGTIMISVSNVTGMVYRADAIAGFSATDKLMQSLHYAFNQSPVAGQYGLLIDLILTLTFVFIGYWSMPVALLLAPLPTFMLSAIYMINFNFWVAGAIWVIFGMIAVWLSVKQ